MAAQIIDGKAMAQRVKAEVSAETTRLRERGLVPGLAVIRVGDDPASETYVNNKERTARELGMYAVQYHLPAATTQRELEALVAELNEEGRIHGILVQSPLPAGLDLDRVICRILPAKDVDGFHPENVGRLWSGQEGLFPCTPVGLMRMLDEMGVDPAGKHAVVVGRSNIVGRPTAGLLLRRNATVTLCHSKTVDLPAICRQADILVTAVGQLKMVQGDWIKPGAVVLDVGINHVPGTKSRVRGDVDFDAAVAVAGMITPVPGGVGPMTIAMLMANTLKAAKGIWRGVGIDVPV